MPVWCDPFNFSAKDVSVINRLHDVWWWYRHNWRYEWAHHSLSSSLWMDVRYLLTGKPQQ